MSVSEQTVHKIAHLARLPITQEEMGTFTHTFNHVLQLIEKMCVVSTENVLPLQHPLDVTQILRPDGVTETNQKIFLQQQATHMESGYYIVPAILEAE